MQPGQARPAAPLPAGPPPSHLRSLSSLAPRGGLGECGRRFRHHPGKPLAMTRFLLAATLPVLLLLAFKAPAAVDGPREAPAAPAPLPRVGPVALGQPFELEVGTSAFVEGAELELALAEDGAAGVRLVAEGAQGTEEVRLARGQARTELFGHALRLLQHPAQGHVQLVLERN